MLLSPLALVASWLAPRLTTRYIVLLNDCHVTCDAVEASWTEYLNGRHDDATHEAICDAFRAAVEALLRFESRWALLLRQAPCQAILAGVGDHRYTTSRYSSR